jgi:hypothetical protein
MDYQEQLEKINNATESGNIADIEAVKNAIETDRASGENMGNAMVMMAAQQALEKLTAQKEKTVTIPDWRRDQIDRTGGTQEEIDRITADINQKTEKSVIQGWYTILNQIPESLRTVEQQRELENLKQELSDISKITEQAIRGVASERIEAARIADNLEKLDLNKISPVDTAINESLGNYADGMSAHIASGQSLWDVPNDTDDNEPVSFTQPIQPTAEKIDQAHKEYLEKEIDTIGAAISAGFGNEQALGRGIQLEQKLADYDRPIIESVISQPVDTVISPENNTVDTVSVSPETNVFSSQIAAMTRDDLGKLYGILQEQGDIDGMSPDQLFAAVKIFMRGASDDSHIPESYGLRAKMNEIKKIRDAELAYHGIVIDKESGAATVQSRESSATPLETQSDNIANVSEKTLNQKTPEIAPIVEMNDREKSKIVLQEIQNASTIEELKSVLQSIPVLYDGDKTVETSNVLYLIEKYTKGEIENYEITNIGRIRDQILKIELGVVPGKKTQVIDSISTTEQDLPSNHTQQESIAENSEQDKVQESRELITEELHHEKTSNIPLPDGFYPGLPEVEKQQKQSPQDLFNVLPAQNNEVKPLIPKEQIESSFKNETDYVFSVGVTGSNKNDYPDIEFNKEDYLEFEKQLMGGLYVATNGEFLKEFGPSASLDIDGYIIKSDGTKTNVLPSMLDYPQLKNTTGLAPKQYRKTILDKIISMKQNRLNSVK